MHLYVTEQGTRLNKCGEHLVVQRDGTTIDDILLSEVDSLSLFGAVHLTTGTILALLDKGTDIAFLSSGGRYRGRLVSSIGKNVPLRLCQYDAFRNRERAFELAKAWIHPCSTISGIVIRILWHGSDVGLFARTIVWQKLAGAGYARGISSPVGGSTCTVLI